VKRSPVYGGAGRASLNSLLSFATWAPAEASESKPHFWLSDFPHKQGTQEDPGTSQSRRL
jgi:hypothetical protein